MLDLHNIDFYWLIDMYCLITKITITVLSRGDLSPVVIWSDGVGDLHLWEDPIHWYSSHGSPEGTAERTETGET